MPGDQPTRASPELEALVALGTRFAEHDGPSRDYFPVAIRTSAGGSYVVTHTALRVAPRPPTANSLPYAIWIASGSRTAEPIASATLAGLPAVAAPEFRASRPSPLPSPAANGHQACHRHCRGAIPPP